MPIEVLGGVRRKLSPFSSARGNARVRVRLLAGARGSNVPWRAGATRLSSVARICSNSVDFWSSGAIQLRFFGARVSEIKSSHPTGCADNSHFFPSLTNLTNDPPPSSKTKQPRVTTAKYGELGPPRKTESSQQKSSSLPQVLQVSKRASAFSQCLQKAQDAVGQTRGFCLG